MSGFPDDPIVRRGHQGAVNSEGDSMVLAAREDDIVEQVAAGGDVNGGGGGGGAGGVPCSEESLGGIGMAVAFGTQINDINVGGGGSTIGME